MTKIISDLWKLAFGTFSQGGALCTLVLLAALWWTSGVYKNRIKELLEGLKLERKARETWEERFLDLDRRYRDYLEGRQIAVFEANHSGDKA